MSAVMNENHIDRIMGKIGAHLFPALGNILRYEVCAQERLRFSEIYRVELCFKECKKTIFLKEYHNENRSDDDPKPSTEREYNILKYLHDKFSPLQGMNVIKPTIFLSDEDILVTEEFAGRKLNALVVEQLRWIPSHQKKKQIKTHFHQCGRWLRHFQEFTNRNEVIPFNKDSYVENMERRLDSCAKYGLKNSLYKKIHGFIDAKFKRIGNQQLDLVGYHSDFTPWNVLASDEGIRVLDFDRFSYRDRYEDLTLFLPALEGNKVIVGVIDRNIDVLKDAFLHGYDTKDMNRDILDLYELKNTLKTLSMIEIHKDANTKFLDVLYERYGKKKQIKLYLSYVDDLTSEL